MSFHMSLPKINEALAILPIIGTNLIVERIIELLKMPDLIACNNGLKAFEDIMRDPLTRFLCKVNGNELIDAICRLFGFLATLNKNDDGTIENTYYSIFRCLKLFFEQYGFGHICTANILKSIINCILINSAILEKFEDEALEPFISSSAEITITHPYRLSNGWLIVICSYPTSTFCALIKLLGEYSENFDTSHKYEIRVFFCYMEELIQRNQLEFEVIFFEIHLFLKEYPSHYFTGKDNWAHRQIQQLIKEIVKLKKDKTMQLFRNIPDPINSELECYTLRALKGSNNFMVEYYLRKRHPPRKQKVEKRNN